MRRTLVLALLISLAAVPIRGARPALAIPGCNSPFSFTGADQTCIVPANATSITIIAIGAFGGGDFLHAPTSPGGAGDSVQAAFAVGPGDLVTPGELLYVEVGGVGTNSGGGGLGGYNGGGDSGLPSNPGGGGGGASDVRSLPFASGLAPDTRLLVAGGGGGSGGNFPGFTAGHGGNAGAAGANGDGGGGQPGTLAGGGLGGTGTGGAGNGGTGTLGGGGGGGSISDTHGGGGGGGYYGGGGGGPAIGPAGGGGGGGGSDFEAAGATGITVTPGMFVAPSITITFATATTTTLSSSPNPSIAGQPVTFTATVSCPGFTPTGTVTFLDGGAVLGSGTLNSAGVALFTTSTLTSGSHSTTAAYNGDINCFAGPSNTVTQVVVATGAPTFTCTPSNLPAGTPTTCTLAFPSPLLPGTTIALNITNPPGATISGSGCSNPTGGLACDSLTSDTLAQLADLATAAPLSVAGSLSLTCPSGCSGGATVQLSLLSPVPGALALSVAVFQPGLPPQSFVLDGVTWVAVSNAPAGEVKYCNNTAVNAGLTQQSGVTTLINGTVIVGSTGGQSPVFAGPATTFTLPLFGPASTCILQPQRLVNGVATNCSAAVACADGYFIVTMTTPGSGAVLSCATSLFGTPPAGTPAPGASGGACASQSLGTQLNLPCGTTSGTPAANTTPNASCINALFDISSTLGACIATPTFCVNPGTFAAGSALGILNQGAATVTVQFMATPANGGTVGGIQLGTNTFSFSGPGIGTLLVAASPQIIPSNGTEASVVSATFACTTGFASMGGFPLSNNSVASPISVLANGQLGVSTTGCGSGLPGTFTFATPGPVLFDNGRSSESISCGPNANVNPFGNGSAFFGGTGTTFPLTFTCTGAAVLAIGAGVAGDAPINVSYRSAVGGPSTDSGQALQAVGSTLLTVSPAGIPRISVACNPSSISAGNTGSLCTATVTDINGVPLSGITGATVTFTTSDTSTTTIQPCTIGTPGAINVTTSPAVLPLVTPQSPCVTPSSVIPGQVNTFINGQATALLVASSTAHPEVVTVTASLGILIPPSFACLVAPYAASGFGTTPTQPGYYAPTSQYGAFGCGATNPIGTTGLATALNVAGGGLTGIVTLPNQTSASTAVAIGGPAGIQIAGASAISPIVLSRGCNTVIVSAPVGTPVANLAALVSPQNSVVSVWRFSNSTKLFQAGFFSEPNAPTDFALTGALSTTTAPNAAGTIINGATISTLTGLASNAPSTAALLTESYYVCVNQQATMISG